MADDVDTSDLKMTEEVRDAVGVILHRVSIVERSLREAKPEEIDEKHPVPCEERVPSGLHEFLGRRCAKPMQEHDRRLVARQIVVAQQRADARNGKCSHRTYASLRFGLANETLPILPLRITSFPASTDNLNLSIVRMCFSPYSPWSAKSNAQTARLSACPYTSLSRSGKIGKVFEQLMADLKPEAAYFIPWLTG